MRRSLLPILALILGQVALAGCVRIVGVNPDPVVAGQQVIVLVDHVIGPAIFEPGLTLTFDGKEMELAPDTGMAVGFKVPEDATPGRHVIAVTDRPGVVEAATLFLLLRKRSDSREIMVRTAAASMPDDAPAWAKLGAAEAPVWTALAPAGERTGPGDAAPVAQFASLEPAPAPAAEPAAATTVTVVTVEKGDSLWRIAARVLGSGERWPEIQAADGDTIGAGGLIHPGQVLILPGSG